MSQVLDSSKPSVVDELKLFDVPKTEKGVVRNEFLEYRPLGQVTNNSPVDFRICTEENQYLDLHRSLLKVRFKVVDKDGASIAPNLSVCFVDTIIHSFWRQVDILLNQTLITSSNNNYAYKANIDFRLHTTKNNNPIAEASGYIGDTWSLSFGGAGNTTRRDLCKVGKIVTVCGPLLADACSTQKWILPGIETVIRLWQNSDQFRITTVEAHLDKQYRIDFQEIVFLANVITVQPEVTLAHKQILQTQTAKYPYKRSQIHSYNIKRGSTFFKQDQIFQNIKPNRLIVAFVTTKGYVGNYLYNPFLYTPGLYDNIVSPTPTTFIKTIDFTVDDKSVNGKPFELSFDDSSLGSQLTGYQDAQYARYSQLGQDCFASNAGDSSAGVSLLEFRYVSYFAGNTFFVFDEYAGLPKPPKTVSEMRKGNSKLNVVFDGPLADNVTAIVYGEFDDMFEIDSNKHVHVHH